MRRDEFLAGAPVVRGRWSAIAMLWWAGYAVGRTQPIHDLWHHNNNTVFDWVTIAMGFAFLVAGVIFLNQYGRNCWIQAGSSWGPLDGEKVKRKPWVRWPPTSGSA